MMNEESLEAEVIEAYREIESSREATSTLSLELQKVAKMLRELPAAVKGPRLVLALGRTVCALPITTTCIVGREGEHLDLALPNPAMSRQHFEIQVDNNRFRLKDTASRNGTLLNSKLITTQTELEDGDIIEAGGHHFVFLHDGQPNDPVYADPGGLDAPGSHSTR